MTTQPLDASIEVALGRFQRPSWYIGGETNAVAKRSAAVRVALCAPDAYAVGITNQPLQIRYTLVNCRGLCAANRVAAPPPDMADALRRTQLPLFTLGAWRPLCDCALRGITLPAGLTDSNVVETLDLAGIALRNPDRGRHHPVVMAGGPSASNREPLAPFINVWLTGAAEEGTHELLAVLERVPDRGRRLDALARLRPVRERAADDVVTACLEASACTGYDELSLTSLATSDYTWVPGAITQIKRPHRSLHLSLPSHRVDTGPVALNAAANARQESITLAPQAATQRMRDIRTTITDEMIEHAIDAAFDAGYTALKRYVMIDPPPETLPAVHGIVDPGMRARQRTPLRRDRPVQRPRVGVESRTEAAYPAAARWDDERETTGDQTRVPAPRVAWSSGEALAPRCGDINARGSARAWRRGYPGRDRNRVAARRPVRREERPVHHVGVAGVRVAWKRPGTGSDTTPRHDPATRPDRCRGAMSGSG